MPSNSTTFSSTTGGESPPDRPAEHSAQWRPLERIYHGANIVKDGAYLAKCHTLIAVLTAAFGHNPDGCRQEIVSGLGFVLLRHLDLDLRKLVTELGKFPGGPLGLCGRAKALRDLSGGNLGHAMAEIITNLHNKGRRTKRLPEWRAA